MDNKNPEVSVEYQAERVSLEFQKQIREIKSQNDVSMVSSYHAKGIYHWFLLDVLQDLSHQIGQFSHMVVSRPDSQTTHRESLSKILYLQHDLLSIPDDADSNLNANTLSNFLFHMKDKQHHEIWELQNPSVLVQHKNYFINVGRHEICYLNPIDPAASEILKARMPTTLGTESISENELAKIFNLSNWIYPTLRNNNIFLLLALCKEWYTRLETEKKYWHDLKKQNQSMTDKFFLAACISVTLWLGINGLAVYLTAYVSLLTTLSTIAALGSVLFSVGLITYFGFTVLSYQKEQAFNAKLNTMNQIVQQKKSYQLPYLQQNTVSDFNNTYPTLNLEASPSSRETQVVITPETGHSIFDFFKQHREGIEKINKQYFTSCLRRT